MNTLARISPQFSYFAISAHDLRPRAPMVSAGSSDARTQEGDKGSALAPTEDAAARRSSAVSGVRGRGEWALKNPVLETPCAKHHKPAHLARARRANWGGGR
jgi:hypothetical protein